MPSSDVTKAPDAAPGGKKGAGMANASINPAANPNAIIGSKAK
ncbi:hypothetical protein [Fimbriimonas ginsengisoli]|uniref:Uncharacterized protein n=1 Tax=Fimbriimonas ginsengisoli Gsoil 348 TaxID=661478 RepID=A0A068NJM9_FIMGI|nr:hypothetical protein [Fimbriimonas ginsengisoli]AIE83818.1 hypothetical protein OP10G_0450 [Fimbriimonas ginsengisoli Gsoil 348]